MGVGWGVLLVVDSYCDRGSVGGRRGCYCDGEVGRGKRVFG